MLDAAEFKIKYTLCVFVGENCLIYILQFWQSEKESVMVVEGPGEKKSEMSTSLSKILPLLHATHATLPHRQIKLTDGCGLLGMVVVVGLLL